MPASDTSRIFPLAQHLEATAEGVSIAAELIRAGRLVAFPTETVYGLGADATHAKAVAGIYTAKGRPASNPLIVHVASLDQARLHGRFDESALSLARAFWPGPLTLVVPREEASPVCDLATAGLSTVALRVPAHATAHALIVEAGRPIAAPSANRSGFVSATSARHVLADLEGRIDAVLDSGPASLGLESTILACLGSGIQLLRPGGITSEAVEAIIGAPLLRTWDSEAEAAPLSPGRLASHYAPHAPVRLNATHVLEGEAVVLFGAFRPEGIENASAVRTLSEDGNLPEAGCTLFAILRELDGLDPTGIAVVPLPVDALGEAITDRLSRAAR